MPSDPLLMASYLRAFELANPMSERPSISYERGWYVIKSRGGYPNKYRAKTLEEMRERLMGRVTTVSA